jgi:hypothetical protein
MEKRVEHVLFKKWRHPIDMGFIDGENQLTRGLLRAKSS